jgi:hypothetical protein
LQFENNSSVFWQDILVLAMRAQLLKVEWLLAQGKRDEAVSILNRSRAVSEHNPIRPGRQPPERTAGK